MDSDHRIIKTYVWHEGICFFVSTIERDSSAMEGPRRYNETFVWRYDWDKRERGNQCFQAEDRPGSIVAHQRTVEAIHDVGEKAFEYRD